MVSRPAEVEPCGDSLYLPAGDARAELAGVSLGKGHPFLHAARESSRRAGLRDRRERLSEAGMVDILGMFRRRPAKRGRAGFARAREDITALGDSFGNMLTKPVRDAPPIARDAPLPGLDLPRPPPPSVDHPPRAEKPRPRAKPADRPANQPTRTNAKTNGAGGPQLVRQPRYLA